jgi:hypothetical protein
LAAASCSTQLVVSVPPLGGFTYDRAGGDVWDTYLLTAGVVVPMFLDCVADLFSALSSAVAPQHVLPGHFERPARVSVVLESLKEANLVPSAFPDQVGF